MAINDLEPGNRPRLNSVILETNNLLFGKTGLVSRSPGIALVGMGFLGVYFFAMSRMLSLKPEYFGVVHYLVLAFFFLLAASGVVLVYAQIRRGSVISGEEPMSVTTSDLEHAVSQLGKNYDILRRQATQGFLLAGTMMSLGVLVILAGSVGQLFGLTKEGSNLTTVAGVVVEVVSGLGLYLFRETFRQLNTTSDRLHDTWKILAAFRRAESIPNESSRSQVISMLITRLVDPAAASVLPAPFPVPSITSPAVPGPAPATPRGTSPVRTKKKKTRAVAPSKPATDGPVNPATDHPGQSPPVDNCEAPLVDNGQAPPVGTDG